MLDHTAYPHILASVIHHSDHTTLVRLRRVSRQVRDQADARLFHTIVLYPSDDTSSSGYAVSSLSSGHLPLGGDPARALALLRKHTKVVEYRDDEEPPWVPLPASWDDVDVDVVNRRRITCHNLIQFYLSQYTPRKPRPQPPFYPVRGDVLCDALTGLGLARRVAGLRQDRNGSTRRRRRWGTVTFMDDERVSATKIVDVVLSNRKWEREEARSDWNTSGKPPDQVVVTVVYSAANDTLVRKLLRSVLFLPERGVLFNAASHVVLLFTEQPGPPLDEDADGDGADVDGDGAADATQFNFSPPLPHWPLWPTAHGCIKALATWLTDVLGHVPRVTVVGLEQFDLEWFKDPLRGGTLESAVRRRVAALLADMSIGQLGLESRLELVTVCEYREAVGEWAWLEETAL